MSDIPRVLVLTSNYARHKYFARELIQNFSRDVDIGVLQEHKGNKFPHRDRRERFFASRHKVNLLSNFVLNKSFHSHYLKFTEEKLNLESQFFGKASEDFDENYTGCVIGEINDVNNPETVSSIRDFSPDLIVVMGTSLIKSGIMGIPRLGIINMHTGLSPYYRGGMTNFFPIYNGEPQYCGVTIHILDAGIDAGEIVYHGMPVISSDDGFASINCKAIRIGTALMKRAINDAIQHRLTAVPQRPVGKLYLARHFNAYHAWRYYRLVDRGVMDEYASLVETDQVMYPPGLSICPDLEIDQTIPRYVE